MVNIWEFDWDKPRVKVKTKKGETVIGDFICAEDGEDDDVGEDYFSMYVGNGVRSFLASQVESIERV